jgi:hypothetical protein
MADTFKSQAGAYVAPRVGNVPKAALANAGTNNGPGIDRTGFGSLKIVAQTGAVTGAPTATLYEARVQHSTDDAATDPYTDYQPDGTAASGKAAVTAANAVASKDVDLGGAKKFIRLVELATLTAGTSPTVLGTSIPLLGGGTKLPAV